MDWTAFYFHFIQVINGISITTYNKNSTLYAAVLAQTISDCMSNITPDEVSQIVATDATTTAVKTQQGDVFRQLITTLVNSIVTTANAISISYVVVDNNPSASYSLLATQLQDAVTSGGFDNFLATNAQQSGAMGLMGCTSTTVTTNQMGGSTSSGSDSVELTDGVVSGLVFAGFMIACILGALVYYCCFNKST